MAAGGWRIGQFAGAPVIVDWSVAILAGYVIFSALDAGGGAALPGAFILLAAIFASILLHEFAHAWTAGLFKLPSKRIVLTFFGGHVEFARPPEKRWHDIAVSAAGPLSNLAAFAITYLGMAWLASLAPPYAERGILDVAPFLPPIYAPVEWGEARILLSFFTTFAFLNLLLGALNLLPGFPLDGGRILSSSLAYVMHPARARITAGVSGALIAAGAGYYGITTGAWWTLMIAVLLLLAALAEISFARRALAYERARTPGADDPRA